MKILYTVCLAVMFTLTASGQSFWNQKAGPDGGLITDIEFDNTNAKVYALVNSRLYISSDDGSTWAQPANATVANGLWNDIEVFSGVIYLLGSFELYTSTNGVDFTQKNTDNVLSGPAKIKVVNHPNTLVAASSSKIFISSNGGQTWTNTLSGSYLPKNLAVNNVGQIFITSSSGLPQRSSDTGVSFQAPTNTNLTGPIYSLVARNDRSQLVAVNATGIWQSSNADSWATIKNGTVTDATIANSSFPGIIEFSADGNGMFFIDNLNLKVHHRTLAGTWAQASAFPGTNQLINTTSAKTYLSSGTNSVVLFGTQIGVYKSSSGGSSNADSNSGLTRLSGFQFLRASNGDLLMNVYDAGLMRSTSASGGDAWTRVTTVPGELFHLTATSNSGTPIYNNSVLALNTLYDLYRSTTGGASWTAITTPVDFYWVQGTDFDRAFALSSSGNTFYFSNTGGNTWNASAITISGLPGSFGIYNTDRCSVYSLNSTSAVMFLELYNDGTSLYEQYRISFTISGSTISGAATKITTIPITTIDKMVARAGKFYVFTDNTNPDQYAYSTNAGTSWTTRNTPATEGNAFVLDNGYVIATSESNDKLFISRDDGVTFEEIGFPSAQHNVFDINTIVLDQNDYAYMVMDASRLYQSANIIVTPATPTVASSLGATSTTIGIRWNDNADNENNYVIERSTNGVDFTTAGTVSSFDICGPTTKRGVFIDRQLTPSTSYTYRVKGVNDAGSSAYLTYGAISTLAAVTPAIPDNRSWSAINAGGGGYAVLGAPKTVGIRSTGNGFYEVSDVGLGLFQVADFKETFHASGGVTQMLGSNSNDLLRSNGTGTFNGSTQLTLKWRKCSDDNIETITFTLNPVASDPTPAAPTSPQALLVGNNQIQVKWTTGFYQTSYTVERSLSSSSGFAVVGSTVNFPSSSLIDTGPFTEGVTYYYRVRARNANNVLSTYSTVASVVYRQPVFTYPSNIVNTTQAVALGAHWADFNADGFQDFMYVGDALTSGKPVIFQGQAGGTFIKHNPAFGTESYFVASVADFNNDGFADIGLAIDSKAKYDLYYGNGDFTFTQLTPLQAGDVAAVGYEVLQGSWADFNNDGRLDLVLVPDDNQATMVMKQTAGGSFTKITAGDLGTDLAFGGAAIWADYNNDGFVDLLITGSAWRLYRNNGNETFTNVSVAAGVSTINASTGIWGDFTGDGVLDLVACVSAANALVKNNNNGTFTVNNTVPGLSEASSPFGAAAADFNNDGKLDLFTAGVLTASRILLNTSSAGTESFNRIIDEKINDATIAKYGASTADFDEDGFPDIGAGSFLFDGSSLNATEGSLYLNNNTTGNWLKVKLVGTSNNRSGVGARITVEAGSKTQIRQVVQSNSFASTEGAIQHFGLGAETAITKVTVKWPSGLIQNLNAPPINQLLTIGEDSQGPQIGSRTPTHNGTAPITTTVSVTFDEATDAVAAKNLVVTGVGDGSPTATIPTTAAAKSGNTFTFTLPALLTPNKLYEITIDAGGFADIYGNPFAGVTTNAWRFTTGASLPVNSYSPGVGNTGVLVTAPIELTYIPNISAVAGKKIQIYQGTTLLHDFDVSTTGTISGNKYTLPAPGAGWPFGTTIRVVLDGGAFKDASGNLNVALSGTDYTFTTVAAPVDPGPQVTTRVPAHNGTAPITTTISITFDEAVNTAPSKSLIITGVGDGTPTATIPTTTATMSGNQVTFTLPALLVPNKLYEVTVDAGGFVDLLGNPFAGVVAGIWRFTTSPNLVVNAYSPGPNNTGISTTAPIELTYVPNISAVPGKKIQIYQGTALLWEYDVSTTGTISGNKYTLPAPSSGWPFESIMRITLDGGAFKDAIGNLSEAIEGTTYRFTTIDAPDTSPPTVTPPSVTTVNSTELPAFFVAKVEDNKQVGSVALTFRKVSGSTTTTVQGILQDPPSANLYRFNFTAADAFDATGTQFFITANDQSSNSTRSPEGTGFHTVLVKYPAAGTQVPSALVGTGGTKSSWRIIAVPFELGAANGVQDVFEELVNQQPPLENKIDYRILTYTQQGTTQSFVDYNEGFNTIDRGKGYFINMKNPTSLFVGNNLTAPTNTRTSLFQLNLTAGWNMIGNPYLSQINWADVVAYNNLTGTATTLKKYSGTYENGTSLAAFEGGFVQVPNGITISIPFAGQTSPGRQMDTFGEGEWLLPIVVEQGESRNVFGGVGMHHKAEPSFDQFDDVNAPRFIDYVEMLFDHPEHFTKRFARDVQPVQNEYTWEFNIAASAASEATLTWGNEQLNSPYDVFLYDVQAQVPVNMKESGRYTFDPRQSRTFRIYYGENTGEKIRPARVVLGAAYPNPATSEAVIPFSLPDAPGKMTVKLEVFDIMGRKVATVVDGELASGFYNGVWRADQSNGQGLYTYRLLVKGANETMQSGKLMLRK